MAAGFALSLPFIAIYLNAKRGMPMPLIGLFFSASVFFASFSQIMGGEISDRIGRKKVMIFALVGRAVSVLCISFLTFVEGNVYFILLAHMAGVFLGAFFAPAADAWIADFTPSAERVKAYGLMRIGINLGWDIGPAFGGMLAMKSYPKMFFITFLATVLCFLVILFFVEDSDIALRNTEHIAVKDVRLVLKNRKFIHFSIYVFFIAIVMSQLIISNSLYATDCLGFTEADVGILFSINGVIVISMQYTVVKMMERFRLSSALALGSVFYGLGYFIFGYSIYFKLAVLAVSIFSLGEIIIAPGIQTLAANLAPERHKGRFLGVMGLFRHTGHSAGILIGTNAIYILSPLFQAAPWYLIAFISSIAALGFYRLGTKLSYTENGGRIRVLKPIENIKKPQTV